jgi:hypothetical protein
MFDGGSFVNLPPIALYGEAFSQIEWHGRPAHDVTRKMRVPQSEFY